MKKVILSLICVVVIGLLSANSALIETKKSLSKGIAEDPIYAYLYIECNDSHITISASGATFEEARNRVYEKYAMMCLD